MLTFSTRHGIFILGGGNVSLVNMKTVYFAVDDELEKKIEEYRYKNHIPNRSEAIRQLIKLGLTARK